LTEEARLKKEKRAEAGRKYREKNQEK